MYFLLGRISIAILDHRSVGPRCWAEICSHHFCMRPLLTWTFDRQKSNPKLQCQSYRLLLLISCCWKQSCTSVDRLLIICLFSTIVSGFHTSQVVQEISPSADISLWYMFLLWPGTLLWPWLCHVKHAFEYLKHCVFNICLPLALSPSIWKINRTHLKELWRFIMSTCFLSVENRHQCPSIVQPWVLSWASGGFQRHPAQPGRRHTPRCAIFCWRLF